MSARAQAKVHAQQKTLIESSPKNSLLQRTCTCGQYTIAGGECLNCRNEHSTVLRSQRTLESSSMPTLAQENTFPTSSGASAAPHFGYDLSRIPIYSTSTPGARLQTRLKVNQPGDSYEQEADQVAEQVMRMTDVEPPVSDDEDEGKNPLMRKQSAEPGADTITGFPDAPPIVHDVLNSNGGQPLDATTRAFMEPRFGHDFSKVRVYTDTRAMKSAHAVNALAYTVGSDIVFGQGYYAPETSQGRSLLAHELTHVVQQRGKDLPHPSQDIQLHSPYEGEADRGVYGHSRPDTPRLQHSPTGLSRKTKGEEMGERADVWLDTEAKTKTEVDVLHAAIREIKAGKSVKVNQQAGVGKIDALAKILSLDPKVVNLLKQDWNWLVEHRKESHTNVYKQKENAFFRALRSPLAQIKAQFPESQAHFWLKNTPPQVAELLYQAASPDLPVDQLYVYAAKEGLIQYVRDRIGLSPEQEPSKAQLAGVSTTVPVSGFDYLGSDVFMTEMQAGSLDKFLPSGFDRSQVHETTRVNEKGTTVHSAEFPNLLSALQGFAAMIRRRRAVFLADAKAFGYSSPTTEELVYWTYVYYNAGEFGGKAQLKKYQNKRKLGDWIAHGEYHNAIVVLQSYKMLASMSSQAKIF